LCASEGLPAKIVFRMNFDCFERLAALEPTQQRCLLSSAQIGVDADVRQLRLRSRDQYNMGTIWSGSTYKSHI